MISRSINILKKYCSEPIENIENYEEAVNSLDKYDCHHRLEVQGQFTNSAELLKKCRMYYNRPASELIFLKLEIHRRLHSTGRRHTAEAKRKISEKRIGIKYSEETLKRMSQAQIGKKHSEETLKRMSQAIKKWHKESGYVFRPFGNTVAKGRIWVNNGEETRMVYSDEIPDGFVRGRLKFNTAT